jgi:hypothetical protein
MALGSNRSCNERPTTSVPVQEVKKMECPTSGWEDMLCYLFVDGAYFREVLENIGREFFGGDEEPTVDFAKFGQPYSKVFYYDCYAPQKDDELDEDYGPLRPPHVFF